MEVISQNSFFKKLATSNGNLIPFIYPEFNIFLSIFYIFVSDKLSALFTLPNPLAMQSTSLLVSASIHWHVITSKIIPPYMSL